MLDHNKAVKGVREWTGHADVRMTADLYGHLDVARKQSMAEKISGVLDENGVTANS